MRRSRYKHVGSRFQQSRTLPASCESWINSTDEDDGSTGSVRLSGDLPENVTEERLHKSRLFDLAKERHKMMQESDYSRNQFIDHQMRKSKTLGRLLDGFDIEQYRNKSTSVVEKLHQKSVHAKLMILATRRLGLTIEETSKFTEEELKQKLNICQDDGEGEKDSDPGMPQRPVTSRTQSFTQPNLLSPDIARPSTVGQAVRRSVSTPRLPKIGSVRHDSSRQSVFYDRNGNPPGAAAARPLTASARRQVQNDPRCTDLIDILTPRYKLPMSTDVDSIIKSNPSLNQPTAGKTEQRQKKPPKTRRQALEMLDGIVRTRYYETSSLASLS